MFIENNIRILTTVEGKVRMSNAEESTFIPPHFSALDIRTIPAAVVNTFYVLSSLIN